MEKMEIDNLFTTVTEAQTWVNANKEIGCICPVCEQVAKIYKRNIYSTPCRDLIKLYRLQKKGDPAVYYHYTKFLSNASGDFAKLTYWGLVEKKPLEVTDEDKKSSGYWRMLPKGILFVENKIKVPKYIFIYDTKLVGLATNDNEVSIFDALGKKFNYSELMNGVFYTG